MKIDFYDVDPLKKSMKSRGGTCKIYFYRL